MNKNTSFSNAAEPNIIVSINTTPLIDVMLVLIIMLIITIPVRLHSTSLDLPNKNSEYISNSKKLIKINIDEFGSIKIDDRVIINRNDLKIIMSNIVAQTPKKNIYIYSHAKSNYGDVAMVMFEARKAGIKEIGFIGIERF